MDVVADTSSVGRRPIGAEHLQSFSPAHCNLAYEWEKVAGKAIGIFTNGTAWMGTHRVEIAQTRDSPLDRI